ncbi:DgyrCDS7258 [Dimorphilus gyrociliatus]|uniref:DgyrCDS7258 n=1 Tax=Dimorphilus gyrociliatus TaxID=2664684 RepID=A0A7I8VSS7_9ANNE|nr:DgyrCDS7258 [Dimorphilus gyrociliatus]
MLLFFYQQDSILISNEDEVFFDPNDTWTKEDLTKYSDILAKRKLPKDSLISLDVSVADLLLTMETEERASPKSDELIPVKDVPNSTDNHIPLTPQLSNNSDSLNIFKQCEDVLYSIKKSQNEEQPSFIDSIISNCQRLINTFQVFAVNEEKSMFHCIPALEKLDTVSNLWRRTVRSTVLSRTTGDSLRDSIRELTNNLLLFVQTRRGLSDCEKSVLKTVFAASSLALIAGDTPSCLRKKSRRTSVSTQTINADLITFDGDEEDITQPLIQLNVRKSILEGAKAASDCVFEVVKQSLKANEEEILEKNLKDVIRTSIDIVSALATRIMDVEEDHKIWKNFRRDITQINSLADSVTLMVTASRTTPQANGRCAQMVLKSLVTLTQHYPLFESALIAVRHSIKNIKLSPGDNSVRLLPPVPSVELST